MRQTNFVLNKENLKKQTKNDERLFISIPRSNFFPTLNQKGEEGYHYQSSVGGNCGGHSRSTSECCNCMIKKIFNILIKALNTESPKEELLDRISVLLIYVL